MSFCSDLNSLYNVCVALCRRVLIVDWDVHHGQGVQYAFQEDPRYTQLCRILLNKQSHQNSNLHPSFSTFTYTTDHQQNVQRVSAAFRAIK